MACDGAWSRSSDGALLGWEGNFAEVVQTILPNVANVALQKQNIERIFSVVEILVPQGGKEVGDVMQITPPEVLEFFGEASTLSRSLCEEFVAKLSLTSRLLSPSRGQCFQETSVPVFSSCRVGFQRDCMHSSLIQIEVVVTPHSFAAAGAALQNA